MWNVFEVEFLWLWFKVHNWSIKYTCFKLVGWEMLSVDVAWHNSDFFSPKLMCCLEPNVVVTIVKFFVLCFKFIESKLGSSFYDRINNLAESWHKVIKSHRKSFDDKKWCYELIWINYFSQKMLQTFVSTSYYVYSMIYSKYQFHINDLKFYVLSVVFSRFLHVYLFIFSCSKNFDQSCVISLSSNTDNFL